MPLLPAGAGIFGLSASVVAAQFVVPGAGPAVTIPLAVSIGAATTIAGVLVKERLRVAREAREAGLKEGSEAKWRETVDHFLSNSERLHEQTREAIGTAEARMRSELQRHDDQDMRFFAEIRQADEAQRESVNTLRHSVETLTTVWQRQSDDLRAAAIAKLLEAQKGR